MNTPSSFNNFGSELAPSLKRRALDFSPSETLLNTPSCKRVNFAPPLVVRVASMDLVSVAMRAPIGTSLKSILEAPGVKLVKADWIALGRSLMEVCDTVLVPLGIGEVGLSNAWNALLPEKGWDDKIENLKSMLYAEEGQKALDRVRTQFPVVKDVVDVGDKGGQETGNGGGQDQQTAGLPLCPVNKSNCATARNAVDGGLNCAEHGHLFHCSNIGCTAWLHLTQVTCLGCSKRTAFGEAKRAASSVPPASSADTSGESPFSLHSLSGNMKAADKDFVFPIGVRPDQKRLLERHLKPVLKMIQNCSASVDKLPIVALLSLPSQLKQSVVEAFESNFVEFVTDDSGVLRAGVANGSKSVKVSTKITTPLQAVEVISAWFELHAVIHPSTQDDALATRDYFLFEHRMAWRNIFGFETGENTFFVPVLAWIESVRRKYQHLTSPICWSLEGDRHTLWTDVRFTQLSRQGQPNIKEGSLPPNSTAAGGGNPQGRTNRYGLRGAGAGVAGAAGSTTTTTTTAAATTSTPTRPAQPHPQTPRGDRAPPYKSQALCFHWRDNGNCIHGTSCRFVHDVPNE